MGLVADFVDSVLDLARPRKAASMKSLGITAEGQASVDELAGSLQASAPTTFTGAVASAAIAGASEPAAQLVSQLAITDPAKAAEILALVKSIEDPFFPACAKEAYTALANAAAQVNPGIVDTAIGLSRGQEASVSDAGQPNVLEAGLRGFGQISAISEIAKLLNSKLPFGLALGATELIPLLERIQGALSSSAAPAVMEGRRDIGEAAQDAGLPVTGGALTAEIPIGEAEFPVLPVVAAILGAGGIVAVAVASSG